MIYRFLLSCLCVASYVDCANILMLYYVPSVSHNIIGKALAKGLADKGHNVTYMSPYHADAPHSNINHVNLDNMAEPFEKMHSSLQHAESKKLYEEVQEFYQVVELLTEQTLKTEAIRTLRNQKQKFDVILSDSFFNTAHLGLAKELNASFIPVSSTYSAIVNHLTGNPSPFSYVPNFHGKFSDTMTFFERVQNSALGVFGVAYMWYIGIIQYRIYEKYFNLEEDLDELLKNIPIVLVNTHFSIESPRPYVPNMIQIGGVHISETEPLPKDLKQFLDGAKDGVVYCSLGSNVKSSKLPKEKIMAFIKTFAKLKQKVLWKWEDKDLPELPENVRTLSWIPQNDVLAHPNVKLFITHGGLLSLMESMNSGVPLIGIPFFGDQNANVQMIKSGGYGLGLNFDVLTEESLSATVGEVLYNPRYRAEMQRRQSLFRDRPQKPIDTAVYWIEHAIRHKGSPLRCAGLDLNFYQYWLLDVVFAIFLTVWVVKKLCKMCCGTKRNEEVYYKKVQ